MTGTHMRKMELSKNNLSANLLHMKMLKIASENVTNFHYITIILNFFIQFAGLEC
jgi:hypothetical protein